MSCYYISFAVLIVASLYLYHVRTVPEKFIAPMTSKIVDIDYLNSTWITSNKEMRMS